MAAYGSLCSQFYDLDKPTAPTMALAYYLERARQARGRILEPMCGSGRFLLPMSMAGIPIDGVDSSPAMLAACRSRARKLGADVSLYLQDLASLDIPHRYSMALIPAGSIGLITRGEELRAALARLRAHLQSKGTVLLEFPVDDGNLVGSTEFAPKTVYCSDGSELLYTCIATRAANSRTIRFAGTYTHRQGNRIGETEVEEITLRLYDSQSAFAALATCGFVPSHAWNAVDLAFLAESGNMLIEARADA